MTEGQYHFLKTLRWLAGQIIDGGENPWVKDSPVNLERVENVTAAILKISRKWTQPKTDPGEASTLFEAICLAGRGQLISGEAAEAVVLFREALQFLETSKFKQDRLSVAELKQNLGTALDIMERTDPVPHESVANLSNNLGLILRNQGDFEKAEEHYLRAQGLFEILIDHELELALVCNNLGTLYWAAGEIEAAKIHHLRALAIRRDHLPGHDSDIGQSVSNLAVVYHQNDQLEDAEELYAEAIKILKPSINQDPGLYHIVAQNYGALLEQIGQPRKAARVMAKAQKELMKVGYSPPA